MLDHRIAGDREVEGRVVAQLIARRRRRRIHFRQRRGPDFFGAGDRQRGLDVHARVVGTEPRVGAAVELRELGALVDHRSRGREVDAERHPQAGAALERDHLVLGRGRGVDAQLGERAERDVVLERLVDRHGRVAVREQVDAVGELVAVRVVGRIDAAVAGQRRADEVVQLRAQLLRGDESRDQVRVAVVRDFLEQPVVVVPAADFSVVADVEDELVDQPGAVLLLGVVEQPRERRRGERNVVAREQRRVGDLLQRCAERPEQAHHLLGRDQVEVEQLGHVDQPDLLDQRAAGGNRGHVRVLVLHVRDRA